MLKKYSLSLGLLCLSLLSYLLLFDTTTTDVQVRDIHGDNGTVTVYYEVQEGSSYKKYIAVVPMQHVSGYNSEDSSGYVSNDILFDNGITISHYMTTSFESSDY